MCSPLTLLFSYNVVTKQLSTIVGAPTFSFLHAICRSQKRSGESQEHRQECLCHRDEELKTQTQNLCLWHLISS